MRRNQHEVQVLPQKCALDRPLHAGPQEPDDAEDARRPRPGPPESVPPQLRWEAGPLLPGVREEALMSSHSDACSAPICFEGGLSPGITDNTTFWYPDEDICGFIRVSPEQRGVRRIQRRIVKRWKVLPPDAEFDDADIGYFTYADLVRRKAVRKGVHGRDREATDHGRA